MELNKTGTSHLDLAEQLKTQVGSEFEQKVDEYKLLLEKWTKTLNDLYAERQEKTIDLLKVKKKVFFCELKIKFSFIDSCQIFKGA